MRHRNKDRLTEAFCDSMGMTTYEGLTTRYIDSPGGVRLTWVAWNSDLLVNELTNRGLVQVKTGATVGDLKNIFRVLGITIPKGGAQ